METRWHDCLPFFFGIDKDYLKPAIGDIQNYWLISMSYICKVGMVGWSTTLRPHKAHCVFCRHTWPTPQLVKTCWLSLRGDGHLPSSHSAIPLSRYCSNIIINQPAGSTAGGSTVTNLMIYQQNVLSKFYKNICKSDFSKVFDHVKL